MDNPHTSRRLHEKPSSSQQTRPHFHPRTLLTRLAFRLLGPILPGLMSRWARAIWFRTRRHEEPARERRSRLRASECSLRVGDKEIQAWYWGDGPVVLLVHGWNGRGNQLCNFIDPLIKAGYRVLSFDAPGHGLSPGKHAGLFSIRDTLLALHLQRGPIHAVIAHSFGVACLAAAIDQGLQIAGAICVSTPPGFERLVGNFTASLEMPDAVSEQLKARLIEHVGTGTWDKFADSFSLNDDQLHCLVIHDEQDDIVDWHIGEQLAASSANAEFILTSELGHTKVLHSRQLANQVVEFIDKLPLCESLD